MDINTCVGRLHVEVSGEGPTVALWHSFLCDGTMWREQVGPLSERYRVVNIDGPGHGRSTPAGPFTLNGCVEAATEILDAVDADRVAWVGLSWGGMVGMRLAIQHPERLWALGLLDTSARAEPPLKKVAYRPLAAINRVFGPRPAIARVLLPIFFARATLRSRPDLTRSFVEVLSGLDRTSVRHGTDAIIFHRDDVLGQLCRVHTPTLVMAGAEDRGTPPDESRRMAAEMPDAELVLIDGAGHLSALERPDAVNRALLSFLERHAPES